MAQRDDEFEDDAGDSDDRDDPDASDMDDDDDPDTVPCPYCGRQILEEAELCPYCRNFISSEDAPRHYPRWLVAGVIVCIVIVLVWVVSNA